MTSTPYQAYNREDYTVQGDYCVDGSSTASPIMSFSEIEMMFDNFVRTDSALWAYLNWRASFDPDFSGWTASSGSVDWEYADEGYVRITWRVLGRAEGSACIAAEDFRGGPAEVRRRILADHARREAVRAAKVKAQLDLAAPLFELSSQAIREKELKELDRLQRKYGTTPTEVAE